MKQGLRALVWLGGICLTLYLLVCLTVYWRQQSMLFASAHAMPVPTDWQPTAGANAEQVLLSGHCGQVHAVRWFTEHPRGTILMFHGNAESLASINDYAYAFLNLDYNLVAWDYPGYGKSTPCRFSQTELLDDAEQVYQWLAKQESPENIVLFGYSLGTALAVHTAIKHRENPVYLVAGYDSMANVAADNMPTWLPVKALIKYPLPAIEWVPQLKQAVYMIHGDHDALIRPERAEKLADSSPNIHLEWVEGAGHTSDSLFFYRNAWLARLLPQRTTAKTDKTNEHRTNSP